MKLADLTEKMESSFTVIIDTRPRFGDPDLVTNLISLPTNEVQY